MILLRELALIEQSMVWSIRFVNSLMTGKDKTNFHIGRTYCGNETGSFVKLMKSFTYMPIVLTSIIKQSTF